MNHRASGILLHPTSLSNPYPIGDLGPAATAFADFMVSSGQRWWQMLPLGPAGEEDSPYQSCSAFGGNPLLVSPDRLVEQGFLGRQDIELPICGGGGNVNYPAAARLKLQWLRKAFEHFERNRHDGSQSEFDAFARAESFWLEDFSLFSAIQGEEGTLDWTRWNQELRTREPDALIRAQKFFAHEIRYHQFVQWQFSVQWEELRAYCKSKGIWLIGDIPLFVAHQSADVWAHPGLFKLDADGNPTVVAGVPPDYFSPTGQVWNVPVYRWEALQQQNYRWWIERLRTALGRFDVNRLDHFIGFVRTYEVPAQAQTAVNGQYQPGGGAPFLQAAREALGSLPVIADDLGATTPEVVALMDQFQIPGTRVLQFEFGANLETHSALPEQHPANSVVYTGTHDNDTTAGWYQKLPGAQRTALQKQLGVNSREVVWAIVRAALASQADTAIVPAQDLLELGSEARMNLPGIANGNWQWRMKDGALTPELAQRLRNITLACGRLSSGEPRPAPRCLEDTPTAQIARRAYELYERRGRQNGQADQDWLHAEREITAEAKRDQQETLNRNSDAVSGHRWCPAHRRVGSSCPQTGGEELQAGVGGDRGTASTDLRHLRGGKAHAGRIFRPGGLLPKAAVHPGSVSALHVRAIETLPRDDRVGRSAQGAAWAGDRRGQQRSARTECSIEFESSSWTGWWILLFPPASSTSASPTETCFGWRWISPRRQPVRSCTSKTPRCSSRSRKAWGFEAFSTRITRLRARNFPHSAWRLSNE